MIYHNPKQAILRLHIVAKRSLKVSTQLKCTVTPTRKLMKKKLIFFLNTLYLMFVHILYRYLLVLVLRAPCSGFCTSFQSPLLPEKITLLFIFSLIIKKKYVNI